LLTAIAPRNFDALGIFDRCKNIRLGVYGNLGFGHARIYGVVAFRRNACFVVLEAYNYRKMWPNSMQNHKMLNPLIVF